MSELGGDIPALSCMDWDTSVRIATASALNLNRALHKCESESVSLDSAWSL